MEGNFPARAQAHMPTAHVPPPTPSPDGLCQASSAASLMPQQVLGQAMQEPRWPGCFQAWEHLGWLGASGMVGSTRMGVGVVPFMET